MASRPPVPVRPSTTQPPPTSVQAADPLYPPQLGTPGATVTDAPPSYEDAMADDIAPADGPRREYSGVTDVNAPPMDEKGAAPKYSESPNNPPGGPSSGGSGGHGAVV